MSDVAPDPWQIIDPRGGAAVPQKQPDPSTRNVPAQVEQVGKSGGSDGSGEGVRSVRGHNGGSFSTNGAACGSIVVNGSLGNPETPASPNHGTR